MTNTSYYWELSAFTIIVLFIVSRLFHSYRFQNRHSPRLPPGPRGWPLVGALPLLIRDGPHIAVAKMAQRYGPVMYLKMGTTGMVVASSPGAALAFLKANDISFSNRPQTTLTRSIYKGEDMGFRDYDPKWKLLRKLSNLHLLGGKAITDSTWNREREVRHMLKAMCGSSRSGRPVAVAEMMSCTIANTLGQMVFSKRIFDPEDSESIRFKNLVVEMLTLGGLFNIGDFISYISWLDLQGIDARMKRLTCKFDELLNEMIEQHAATAHQRIEKPDFLDLMMDEISNSSDEKLSMKNIKGLLLDFFVAGTDTTSSSIEWALTELLRNPQVLNRAREEMDHVVGLERLPCESDLPNLPYIGAVCKETLRLHPAVPLVPRVSTKDVQVDGYDIPGGTRLSVNVWAIGRDPDVWENPMDFMPERFLAEKSISPWGTNFEFIPFGAGRRICAGMRLGMLQVEHIVATLVHAFEWKLPDGINAGELNMDESFGLTLQKAVPLLALVSQRLSPSAYRFGI